MAETITVHGLREVQDKIRTLPLRMKDRVILGSLRQGANVIRVDEQSKAPEGKTGKLKRGIVVKNSKIHKGTMSSDLIGVYITIKSKKKGDPFYWRFQNDGWLVKGKYNELRRNAKVKRVALFTRRSIGNSRVTLPGRQFVLGKDFVGKAFRESREKAVDVTRKAAIAATELLARKLGL